MTKSHPFRIALPIYSMTMHLFLLLPLVAHLPSWAGVPMVSEGEFSVDDFGAATYQFPIYLPPGINGHIPTVSLAYSSLAGDGIAGQGWALKGVPIIQRCPSSFPPQASVRSPAHVVLDSRDSFCLDKKKLTPSLVSTVPSAVEYTTVLANFHRIAAYPQNFSSTTPRLGPASFTVWTQDNKTIHFQRHKITNQHNEEVVHSWLASRILDAFDNEITIEYKTDGGVPYLSVISYAGNALHMHYQNRKRDISHFQAGIKQVFAKRLSRIEVRAAGELLRNYQLHYNQQSPEDSASLSAANISNGAIDQQDTLARIQECARLGASCLPPIRFIWGTVQGENEPYTQEEFSHDYEILASNPKARHITADFNGDGRNDIYQIQNTTLGNTEENDTVFLSQGGGYFRPHAGPLSEVISRNGLEQLRPADFNGDGLADLYHFRHDSVYDDIYLTFLTEDGGVRFERIDGIPKTAEGPKPDLLQCLHISCLRFADFNGDGRSDIYRIGHTPARILDAFFFMGDGGVFSEVSGIGFTIPSVDNTLPITLLSLHTGDFNGDKRMDLYVIKRYGGDIYTIYEDGEHGRTDSIQHDYTLQLAEHARRFQFGDFNGDGLTDIYLLKLSSIQPNILHLCSKRNTPGRYGQTSFNFRRLGSNMCLDGITDQIFLGHGDGTFSPVSGITHQPYGGVTLENFVENMDILDINGDGRDDLIQLSGRECLSLADGSVPLCQKLDVRQDLSTLRNLKYLFNGDITGNGRQELVFRDQHYVKRHASGKMSFGVVMAHNSPQSPLLVQVQDGLDNRRHIHYGRLNDKKWHLVDTARTYPVTQIESSLPVVVFSAIEGLANSKHYRYANFRIDQRGYGLLGFAWRKEIAPQPRTVTHIAFRQDYPFINSIQEQRVEYFPSRRDLLWIEDETPCCTDDEGILFGKTAYHFSSRLLPSGSLFAHQHRKTQKDYDRNFGLIKTTEETFHYNDWGNITISQQDVIGGGRHFTRTIEKTYANDLSRWQLGKVTQVTEMFSERGGAGGSSKEVTKNTKFIYKDGFPIPVQKIQFPESDAALKTAYFYDRHGNLTASIESGKTYVMRHGKLIDTKQSRVNKVFYNAQGKFVVRRQNAKGHTASRTVDPFYGTVLSSTDANRIVTRHEYDDWGRKTFEHTQGKAAAHWQYTLLEDTLKNTRASYGDIPSSAKYMIAEHRAQSGTRVAYFDRRHQLVREARIESKGNLIFIDRIYDEAGRLAAVTQPYFHSDQAYWTEFTYDEHGRQVSAKKQLENQEYQVIRTEYKGLEQKQINSIGQTKTIIHDVLGRTVRVQDPLNSNVSFVYDPAGRLLSTTDAKGAQTFYEYDPRGYKTVHWDENIGKWHYRHDSFGHLIETIDAENQKQVDIFDKLGRKIRSISQAGHSRWIYDSVAYGTGKLAKEISHANYVTYYVYDKYSRVSEHGDLRGYSIKSSYDNQGKVTKLVYPNGFEIENIYDDAGKLVAVQSPRKVMKDFDIAAVTDSYLQSIKHRSTLTAQILYLQARIEGWKRKYSLYKMLATGYLRDPNLLSSHGGSLSVARLQSVSAKIMLNIKKLQNAISKLNIRSRYYANTAKRARAEIDRYHAGSCCPPSKTYSLRGGGTLTKNPTEEKKNFYHGFSSQKRRILQLQQARDLQYANRLQNLRAQRLAEISRQSNYFRSVARSLPQGRSANISRLLLSGQELATAQSFFAHLSALHEQHTKRQHELLDADQLISALMMSASQHRRNIVRFWQALDYDASTRVTDEMYANGLRTHSYFSPTYGSMSESITFTAENIPVRHLEYRFDKDGNLMRRNDQVLSTTEIFSYDQLNRLSLSIFRRVNTRDASAYTGNIYQYDINGNFRYRSGVGNYHYDSKHPHRVAATPAGKYQYDQNGYTTETPDYRVQWSPFYKPETIFSKQSSQSLNFFYDASHRKIAQWASSGMKTHYFTKYYEKSMQTDGSIEHKNYLYAAGRMIGLHVRSENSQHAIPTHKMNYFHWDALGSPDAVSDSSGDIVQRLSYTPFGKLRSAFPRRDNSWQTTRGFTGHEHLANFNIIDMKGRLYDAHLGRFLSPDPHIQSPGMTQNYNRYSYALNNPLRYTDPSGYFFKSITKIFRKIFSGINKVLKSRIFRTIAMISASHFISQFSSSFYAQFFAGEQATFINKVSGSSKILGALPSGSAVLGDLTSAVALGAANGEVNWIRALIDTATAGLGRGVDSHFGHSWNAPHIAARTTLGGSSSAVKGDGFLRGALYSAAGASSMAVYLQTAKFNANLSSGGNSVIKKYNQMPIAGVNNIGLSITHPQNMGWLSEGGPLSQVLNHIPGLNAVAGLHDAMLVTAIDKLGPNAFAAFNIPTMPLAGAVTFTGLTLHTPYIFQ